jgi:predicted metal-dependent peptidase
MASHAIESVKDKITTARVKLLFSQPFFGNMATRLKVKDASEWCQTAATEGTHLYYNHDFFDKMSVDQVVFVVAHEILHNVFAHMDRVEGRNRKIWNIACDYTVNGQLMRDRIGTPPDIKFFHDTKYYGMGAEEIYDELMQNSDEELLNQLGELVDEHIDWEEGDGEGSPRYSKEELKQIRDQVIEGVIQASQAAGAGNVPAEIARLIKSMTEPKMNWREMLRNQIQSVLKNDFTWQRPNRKAMSSGIYLPGISNDETIDVCVALDMSGSISDEQARDFLSEVKGIMDEYRDYSIKLWTFDTKTYNVQDFSMENGEDLLDYNIIGGGGTDFECNWNMMKENDIVPKKFIMFTDMYPCGGWGDEDYCDTIFLGHGTTTIVAPFGETYYYDDAK